MILKAKASFRLGTAVLFAMAAAVGAQQAGRATSFAVETAPAPTARPNVVLIVLDDVGFSDLGAFGSEIRTPTIDALAKEGLRYNRFDTKAICSATRAALLTGRNNQTIGMEDLAAGPTPDPDNQRANRGEMPTNAETLAQALRAANYATYALGKWHLAPGYDDAPGHDRASWPLQRGFDHFYGFLRGFTDQYKPKLIADNAAVPTPTTPGYHLTVDLVDHALSNFDEGRASGKPVFLYLALGTAHQPIQVPRAYIDAYATTYAKGWDAVRRARFEREKAMGIIPANTKLPPINPGDRSWSSLSEQEKRVFSRFMAAYAGFITHADEQIGKLVAHLKQTGQYDNTVFVVLSDNGAAPEGGQNGGFRQPYLDTTPVAEMARDLDLLGGPDAWPLYQRPWAMAGVTPFRRYKLWPYAGGTRTPLIISWKGHIASPGAIRHQFVDAIDIAPTLLDISGTRFRDTIDDRKQIPVAGRSILPTFTSASASTRTVQFFELGGNRAITVGRWKAVAMHRRNTSFARDRWQLFDTGSDFSEAHDLALKYPNKLAELQRLWWREARRYSNPPVMEASEERQLFGGYQDDFPKPKAGKRR